jgi:hypothetical protein
MLVADGIVEHGDVSSVESIGEPPRIDQEAGRCARQNARLVEHDPDRTVTDPHHLDSSR